MLLEAFEILQSAGQDEDTFVTDFAKNKITSILTTYIPLVIATFLLSQEYLGEKIVCFAPENFTDGQAEALNEYCWTNGFWVSDGVELVKSLYTQPHRYYPLYLPIQVVLTMTPVILWNIQTKSQLLAVLRGTEEFLEDLHGLMNEEQSSVVVERIINRMKQFHHTCITACETSNLAKVARFRMVFEMCVLLLVFTFQFLIYSHQTKTYHCKIIELYPDEIMCTVPTLDLLDAVWAINVACILISMFISIHSMYSLYRIYNSEFQPVFFNDLPYGDTDDFNETVEWKDRWVMISYLLLLVLFLENNSIMTRSYVLQAMKPMTQESKEGNGSKDKETVSSLLNGDNVEEQNRAIEVKRKENEGSSARLTDHTDDSHSEQTNGGAVTLVGTASTPESSVTETTISDEGGNNTVRYRLTVATRLRPVGSSASESSVNT